MKDSETKDIKYIVVQYFQNTGKKPTKITLCEEITRADALKIAGLIDSEDVFSVTCWTTKNTFI